MKNVAANVRPWFAGLLTALAGVAVARGLIPISDGTLRPIVTVAGQLLAFAGLLIICLGVRRRIQRTSSAGASPQNQPPR